MIPGERSCLANSLWTATANPSERFPRLTEPNLVADVAIVGAGITGLSAAVHLGQLGVRAVVLDAQAPGWGASGRNGGQVLPGLKEDPDTIERMLGSEIGKRMVQVSGNGPDEVFDLIAQHGIACDPVRAGWIQPAHSAPTLAASVERVRQWQERGVAIEALSRETVTRLLGTDAYIGGALDHRAGSIHPLNYCLGLAATATRSGIRICSDSPVTAIERAPIGAGYRLTTPQGAVQANQVLVCTNGYTPDVFGALRRSVVPVCSVQVATSPLAPALRQQALAAGQVVSDMYRLLAYYRFDAQGRLLIGVRGAYGRSGILRQMQRARLRAAELFREVLGELTWEFAWGGNVAITRDHFPRLNRLRDGVYSAVGYNGRGIAMATVLGRILAQKACEMHDDDLDFPVTPVAPIALHSLHRLAVGSAVAWNGLLDRKERKRAAS